MMDLFDPFQQWLGIPPENQPPNHYQLLGVMQFESDLDAITTAIEDRTRLIQAHARDEHEQVAQKLIDQIALAGACLLDPNAKSEYDQQLIAAKFAPVGAEAPKSVPDAPSSQAESSTKEEIAVTEDKTALPDSDSRPDTTEAPIPLEPLDDVDTVKSAADDDLDSDWTESDESSYEIPDDLDLNARGGGFELPDPEPSPKKTKKKPKKKRPSYDEMEDDIDYSAGRRKQQAARKKGLAVVALVAIIGVGVYFNWDSLVGSNPGATNVSGISRVEKQRAVQENNDRVDDSDSIDSKNTDTKSNDAAQSVAAKIKQSEPQDLGNGISTAKDDSESTSDANADDHAKVADEDGLIDLLAEIDPKRDAVNGAWLRDQDGAIGGTNRGQLSIPRIVPLEYELTAVVEPADRTAGIGLGLVVGGHHAVVQIDGWGGTTSGLGLIDGAPGDRNDTASYGRQFPDGQPSEVHCTVRPDFVAVSCNGQSIVEWKGEAAQLALADEWKAPATRQLFIAGVSSNLLVLKLTLKPLSEEAPSETFKRETDERLAVPSDEDQKTALNEIRRLFQKDYSAAAKDPDQKAAFIELLLSQGADESNNDATRYVLLTEARDLAAGTADFTTTFDVVAKIEKQFRVDHLDEQFAALRKLRSAAVKTETLRSVIETAQDLANQAIEQTRHEFALTMLSIASTTAGKIRDRQMVREIENEKTKLTRLQSEKQRADAAVDKLKQDPNDAKANSIRGKYLCLRRNQWVKGLQLLGKGDDDELRALIKGHQAMPSDPKAQVALADRWWNWIQAAESKSLEPFAMVPKFWYSKALPKLTGLQQVKVQRQLDALPPNLPRLTPFDSAEAKRKKQTSATESKAKETKSNATKKKLDF